MRPDGSSVTRTYDPVSNTTTSEYKSSSGSTTTETKDGSAAVRDDLSKAEAQGSTVDSQRAIISDATNAKVADVVDWGNALKWIIISLLIGLIIILIAVHFGGS